MVRFAVAALTVLAATAPARGAFQFRFDAPAPTVAVGEAVDVSVYLVETGGTVLATDGLIGTAVAVGITPETGRAGVLSAADVTANPGFDLAVPTVGPAEARLDLFAFSNPEVKAGSDGRVLVGTFRFTGLAEGTVRLRAADPAVGVQTITGGFAELDGQIQAGTATLTVTPTTVVPCPPAAWPALVAAAGVLVRARRRGN